MYLDLIVAEPGPVIKLKITDITKSSVTMTWVPPERTGGGKITGYIVEYQV